MNKSYYREKVIRLHDKLFLSSKSAREKFVDNDEHWDTAYLAAKGTGDKIIIAEWDRIWTELTSKKSPIAYQSDFIYTVQRKRNRSLEKYLLFVLEQYSEVIHNK